MHLPAQLESFSKKAADLLNKGLVGEVEFSGPTYQIFVKESAKKEGHWAFLQLTEQDSIKDAFCSCEAEDPSACIHVTAAYLRIFEGRHRPIHKRYHQSVWQKIGFAMGAKVDFDEHALEKNSQDMYALKGSLQPRFQVQAKNPAGKKLLRELIEERLEETEETSLKFSNLSSEEMEAWRRGHPTEEMKFELSFWGDLSKQLFLFDESGEKGTIQFKEVDGIPLIWEVQFPSLEARFQFDQEDLPELISGLTRLYSCKSSLSVQSCEESLYFDEKSGELSVLGRNKKERSSGISIDGWVYHSGKGFQSSGSSLLSGRSAISGEEVRLLLEEHGSNLSKQIENTDIHDQPISLSTHLWFDDDDRLHIERYLFEKGDLLDPHSYDYGSFVYVKAKGFFPVQNRVFQHIETTIPKEEVQRFVSQNKTWFNEQKGFETHVNAIDVQLSYAINDSGELIFIPVLNPKYQTSKVRDFGHSIFVEGEGFYPLNKPYQGLSIRPMEPIQPDEISLFIRMNEEELRGITGFYSSQSPILRSGLRIDLTEDEWIQVTLDHERAGGYRDRPLLFFGDFVYCEGEGFHQLPIDPRIPARFREPYLIQRSDEEFFLEYELEELMPLSFFIDPKLLHGQNPYLLCECVERLGEGRYRLLLSYTTNLGSCLVYDLEEALRAQRRFYFSEAGCVDLSQNQFQWLKGLENKDWNPKTGEVELSAMELLRIHARFPLVADEQDEGSKQILDDLLNFSRSDPPKTKGLLSELRPYQHTGLQWLWHLYQHDLGGLLCDDMGLGKTHQAMALLSAIEAKAEKANRKQPLHFLVVCPTSVLYHWQDKLHAFFPGMRVYTFYGKQRDVKEFREDYDILLTSYGIWRKESQWLKEIPFEAAIFDEVQAAKNVKSLLNKTLRLVQSKVRIGMTGTPIENDLSELKALFDLVLPGLLLKERDFQEQFVKPIEKHGDQSRKVLLRKIINPFFLRRKKEQVLTDLPEKVEEIAHCPLLEEQRKLYQDVLQASRQQILKQMEDTSSPIPFMHVFAALTKLKQICNHPAVYFQNPAQYKQHFSGKWRLFVELIQEARASGQKIVVFSQYLGQLDIIQAYLTEQGVGYASIRGATIRRGEEVKRFQEDPACEVFVASIQAAGVGIDLTAASVVIHYDRMWTAARENQATDRVHRIGQTRGVQVFKLMTRGTFEERIDEIIRRKGILMEEIVQADDQHLIKHFDREDIVQLLSDPVFTDEDLPESY